MVYTKEKFKELWESGEDGGGITCNLIQSPELGKDIIDCHEE